MVRFANKLAPVAGLLVLFGAPTVAQDANSGKLFRYPLDAVYFIEC